MARALYRIYRPKSLSEVVGQEQVTVPLQNALGSGKVSHAYLFVGPRGTGKTSVARIFAHAVNNFEYEIEDDYVDIIEIDGASNRGIDNIRELREKAAIAPTVGKYKIYIIDEVHMLTKEAFNALLKTLEEPPSHVIFIMATTDAYKVPVTITSRAQTYTFKLVDGRTMQTFLKDLAKKAGIKISDDALELIVKRGGGSFRDSISLLDQISTLSTDEITRPLVVSAMGVPEDETVAKILNSYAEGDTEKVTELLKGMFATGVRSETIVSEMIEKIIDNPKPELLPLLEKLPEVKAPFIEARLLVALIKQDTHSRMDYSPSASKMSTSSTFQKGNPKKDADEASALRTSANRQSVVPQPTEKHIARNRADEEALPEKNPPEPLGESISGVASVSHAAQARSRAEGALNSSENSLTDEVKPENSSQQENDFNWQTFLDKVRELNDAIYSQILKVEHEISGGVLKIYPNKKIIHTILSRENNRKILATAANNLPIKIMGAEERLTKRKDELITKISDIMGGEVQSDGGSSPF